MGLAPDDPTPTESLAHQLQARGVKTIIVTRGEQGVLILTGEAALNVPAIKVEVVDTTGAGDAFNAGLAVALAEGKDILSAAKFGACAGALACTKLGVIPALAFRQEVEALYNQNFR
jgi:ribokinase